MHEHVQFIGLHYLRAKKTSINLEMLSNMPGLPIDSVIFKKSSIFVICWGSPRGFMEETCQACPDPGPLPIPRGTEGGEGCRAIFRLVSTKIFWPLEKKLHVLSMLRMFADSTEHASCPVPCTTAHQTQVQHITLDGWTRPTEWMAQVAPMTETEDRGLAEPYLGLRPRTAHSQEPRQIGKAGIFLETIRESWSLGGHLSSWNFCFNSTIWTRKSHLGSDFAGSRAFPTLKALLIWVAWLRVGN